MNGKVRVLLLGAMLVVALVFANACSDPRDLPMPEPQPVQPLR